MMERTLDRLADGVVEDVSAVRAVDSESEGVGSDDAVDPLLAPLLVDFELVRLQDKGSVYVRG